jgi:hypothetical protein
MEHGAIGKAIEAELGNRKGQPTDLSAIAGFTSTNLRT